jgi:hypothetical protein
MVAVVGPAAQGILDQQVQVILGQLVQQRVIPVVLDILAQLQWEVGAVLPHQLVIRPILVLVHLQYLSVLQHNGQLALLMAMSDTTLLYE